ncbi:MAG: adenosylmethionine--8-amino-7-oxononanoate transaminase [Deltaproteobacteria bacterium]|nr:adenosylmethionine--8-amino-7-oxononanoate transaminase [Deltaproteobacteria bacterium]
MSLADLDKQVMWHPFTQMAEWDPLVVASAEGSFLIDESGRRYLDGVGSLWCNVHGHRHPSLDRALAEQLAKVAHSTFLGLSHEPGVRLGAALIDVAPAGLSRVFYSDSGSTAVEIALKQSFQFWQLNSRPKKQRFLRLGDAYHGDTLGAVGVGGIELFHRVFGPLLVRSLPVVSPAGTDGRASLQQLEAMLDEHGEEIAAFVVEPLVQGAAGMLVHPRGFLASAARLCRQHSVHLIVDEVATGFGRTGTLFACEQEGVSPDFMCLAKGISGGYLPLAATLTTEAIYGAFLGRRDELKHFFHGHTYTANPLACAVGVASLELLLSSTLENARARIHEVTASLTRLAAFPTVRETRQCGMMVGIELHAREGRSVGVEVCQRARAHGVILRPLGDVLVWMPPLSISKEELELLEQATTASIADVLG